MIGMTAAEYRQQQADAMTEAQLQRAILGTKRAPGLADGLGWRGYHTHRSDRSPAGFPDLVLIRRGRLIVAELKKQKRSNPTEAQRDWLEDFEQLRDGIIDDLVALGGIGILDAVRDRITVALWRPLDLLDGTIEAALRVSE